jgi:L-lactate utilization protein LutB
MRVPITFRERTRETLRQTAGTAARLHTADVFDAARLAHVHNTPAWSAAVAEARAIRLRTLHNLAGYLEQLECTIMARGGRVVWARDGDEAARYIVQLAQTSGVSLAVQGRTTLADEIALAAALRQANVRLQPTNVGDYLANPWQVSPTGTSTTWHAWSTPSWMFQFC